MDTNAFFNQPEDTSEEVVAPVAKRGKKNKSQLRLDMEQEYRKTIEGNPGIIAEMGSKSKNLAVVNSLASRTLQNFIQDKVNKTKYSEKSGKEVRNLVQVIGLCGYKLKNLGDEPIVYKTAIYHKDENGIYQGEEVEKTAAPGEEFCLARKYFTILTCRPEYSFILANGIVVTGKDISNCVTMDEKLERPHFQFNPDENGTTVSIHDDSVKIPVEGPDGVVLPEYEEIFGFLYNPKKDGGRASGSKRRSVSAQELAANYFNSLLSNTEM